MLTNIQEAKGTHCNVIQEHLTKANPDSCPATKESKAATNTNRCDNEIGEFETGMLSRDNSIVDPVAHKANDTDHGLEFGDKPSGNLVQSALRTTGLHNRRPPSVHWKDKWICSNHRHATLLFNHLHKSNKKYGMHWVKSLSLAVKCTNRGGGVTSLENGKFPPVGRLVVLCDRQHRTDVTNMGEFSGNSNSRENSGIRIISCYAKL